MYIPNIAGVIKKMSVNEIRDFIFENFYKQIGFFKESSYYSIYVSKKCCGEEHVNLLLRGEEGKRHYVLIKDFNTLMYDHTLHHGRKCFCFVAIVCKLSVQKKD